MNLKWKNLAEFVDWCGSHADEGMTIDEIALKYLGLSLGKIPSKFARRYYRNLVRSRIVRLKLKCKPKNKVHFISMKAFKRGGETVLGYGSLVPDGAEALYLAVTNRMVDGIHKNHRVLADTKRRLGVR